MSTQEEPSEESAEIETEPPSSDAEAGIGATVALVDLFDQLDRAAFTRSLEQRSKYYSFRSDRDS